MNMLKALLSNMEILKKIYFTGFTFSKILLVLLLSAAATNVAVASEGNSPKHQCPMLENRWFGYPDALTLALQANYPNTLPNVRGYVFDRSMTNLTPGALEMSPTTAGSVVLANTVVNPIYVMVPPSYFTDCNKRYPVVYVRDGQYAIDDWNAKIGLNPYVKNENLLDEALDQKSVQKEFADIGEFIFVFISDQFSATDPNRGPRTNMVGPQPQVVLDRIDFFYNGIKPAIDAEFRTLPNRENTILRGVSSTSGFIEQTVMRYPNFAGKIVAVSNVGLSAPVPQNTNGGINSLWHPSKGGEAGFSALCDPVTGLGLKYYTARGIDSTSGSDFGGKARATAQINYLLNRPVNGFVADDGTNFNSKCLLIVENLPGRRGDTHRANVDGTTTIDGLLRTYGHSSIPIGKPFHLPVEPSIPHAPILLSVPSNTEVRLLFKLPKFDGENAGDTDGQRLGIQEWSVKIDNLTTGVTTTMNINANTLLATPSNLYAGTMRNVGVNLVPTTNLEWTVQGLNPNDVYSFRICARNQVSICLEEGDYSKPSPKVTPANGMPTE